MGELGEEMVHSPLPLSAPPSLIPPPSLPPCQHILSLFCPTSFPHPHSFPHSIHFFFSLSPSSQCPSPISLSLSQSSPLFSPRPLQSSHSLHPPIIYLFFPPSPFTHPQYLGQKRWRERERESSCCQATRLTNEVRRSEEGKMEEGHGGGDEGGKGGRRVGKEVR